jgi:hypothetical protein
MAEQVSAEAEESHGRAGAGASRVWPWNWAKCTPSVRASNRKRLPKPKNCCRPNGIRRSERKSLALIDQKLTQQRITTASEMRASQAIAGRLEAEKRRRLRPPARREARLKPKPCSASCRAGRGAISRQGRSPASAAGSCQAHAAMQRKVADTTAAMTAAKHQTAGTGNPPSRGCPESAGLGAG